jgi:GntR family transcriptional regulator
LPLYHQLQQAIRDRIAAEEWKPGDQIPTIRELCDLYGVSRITVVQALGVLAQEGLLTRRQGKGVFVAVPKIEQGPVALMSFTEEMTSRGHVAASRTVSLTRESATPAVASKLELTPDELVVSLRRLRIADGQTMGVQQVYLPERLFPGLADVTEPIDSLYGLLEERYDVIPTAATDTYEPICLDRVTAALLEGRTGDPAFSVERITRDQHGRVFEHVVSVLRGDRYKVVLQLQHP